MDIFEEPDELNGEGEINELDGEPSALEYGTLWIIEAIVLNGFLRFLLSGTMNPTASLFYLLIGGVGSALLLFYNVQLYVEEALEYHGVIE